MKFKHLDFKTTTPSQPLSSSGARLSALKSVQAGDIVDIVLPSSPLKNNRWKKGFTILRKWGLKPRLADGDLSSWLFHSNNNKKRFSGLNKAFFNTSSSVVWMMRGGYGLQKIMPAFIKSYSKNYKIAKKKLFIGYSDGTALHLYLNGQNQPTLQAPLISELPNLSQKDLTNLKNILFGIKKEVVFNNLCVQPADKVLSTGRIIKAPIIGGNLSLLSTSIGTPWFPPSFAKHFLFVEDINEADYRVDRMLYHLFYSGALRSVKAILFGCFFKKQPALKKVLKSFSDGCDIPLIFGLPCGHSATHQPLPFKTPAELTFKENKASLKISCFSAL